MNVRDAMPPQDRDFVIYRRIKVDRLSTREAAEEAGLSQTRICQVMERMEAYVTETAPGSEEDEKLPQRLYVARCLAAERLEAMYGRAVRAYDASRGPETVVREVEGESLAPRKVTTKRDSHGDPRYLAAAARVALLGGKMPISTLGLMLARGQEENCEEQREDVEPTAASNIQDVSDDATSPVRDCSVPGREQPVTSADAVESAELKSMLAVVYESQSSAGETPAPVAQRPVQMGSVPRRKRRREERRKAFLQATG
jgi:hypothetical protein